MEQLLGFVAQGESSLACKLHRSLYGLKQSPKAWFNRFSSVIQEFGMIRSTTNHSVFYHHTSTGIEHETQNLFHLSSPLCSTACTPTEAPFLLHSRLDYPSLSKFRKLVPHISSLSSLECESCQLWKHTRGSFPKRLDPRTKSPFELVHTNVF